MVDLHSGEAHVEISPDIGGAIASFQWRGHDVLRPTSAAARLSRNVREFSSYALIPYSNRIAQASLALRDGTTFALRRNFGDHPHAIHGVGWQRPWSVEAFDQHSARLAFEHRPVNDDQVVWPFAFRATQFLAVSRDVDASVLTMTLAIENTDSRAFPFGLGWHPFFPRDHTTRLGFAADGVWETDATCLPVKHVAIPDAWRFDPARAIGAVTLDNVFSGWNGRASLRYPHSELELTIEADGGCDHLVVFIPPDREYLAVEPVTHMTDAFNRDARSERGTGTRILGPGQAYCCTMRIVASTSAPIESA